MSKIDLLPLLVATGTALYISLIDIREYRIPNIVLLPGMALTSILMFVIVLIDSRIEQFFTALLGGLIGTAVFFVLHLINPKGLGMGDVKFAALIGLATSWIAFPTGLLSLAIAFVISSIFSVIQFVFMRGSMRQVLPFAPFMFFGLFFVEIGLLL